MDVAKRTAELSTAKKLKVGAIIVKDKRIVSIGYNGTPSGWDNNCEDKVYMLGRMLLDEKENEKESEKLYPYVEYLGEFGDQKVRYALKTKPEVLHAELNCIGHCCAAGESTLGSSMFVTTAPCLQCALIISASGIGHVYYNQEYKSKDGLEFLNKKGIIVKQV